MSNEKIEEYFEEYFSFFEDVLIDSGILNIFYDKLKRQTRIILRWLILHGGIGFLEAVTGFGKTYVAIFGIKRLHYTRPNARVIVVVPTSKLYQDWTDTGGHIDTFNLRNVNVYIVNTYTNKDSFECELLIADELHHYCSNDTKYFNRVLNITKFKYFLGLSATLDKEEKEFLTVFNIPKIDEVNLKEAERNNYISNFVVYNLAMFLEGEAREYYEEINQRHNVNYGKFIFFDDNNDNWKLARACASPYNARTTINGITKTGQQWREWYAREQGWRGSDTHLWSPKNIAKYANIWNNAMTQRRAFLYKNELKARFCAEVIEYVGSNTVVFSESTEFADMITEKLGDKCRSYHSNLETEEMELQEEKVYKSLHAAKKFAAKQGVKPESSEDGEYIVKYKKLKKLGKTALKRIALDLFQDGKISVLSTARSLDEGFDVKNIGLVIVASGSSKKRQYIQRVGRAVRFVPGKTAIIVNVYIKDTKDEDWLKSRQKGSKKPIWINNIGEIELEHYAKGVNLLLDDN